MTDPPPELETPRLRLRAWRAADAPALARLNANGEVMRHMGRGPMTRKETDAQIERVQRHWREHGFGLWAVEEKATRAFIGRAGLSFHVVWPDDPEVGWFFDRGVWGRGLATEAGAAAVAYGFRELGAERLVSICTAENTASQRVMEKLGFRYLTDRYDERVDATLRVHVLDRPIAAGRARRDRQRSRG